jgi:hypothetical protein|tara:strand:- start:1232 stop:1495 length:264 start_codon:yes stop_codon:yes gene_type:complete
MNPFQQAARLRADLNSELDDLALAARDARRYDLRAYCAREDLDTLRDEILAIAARSIALVELLTNHRNRFLLHQPLDSITSSNDQED